MLLIDQDNAEAYLRDQQWIPPQQPVRIRELAGGVSNTVLHVEPIGPSTMRPFVVKQARPQLRVAVPWYCSVERIWREVAVLRICRELLGASPADPNHRQGTTRVTIPEVLYEDRDHYAFAMTAAPRGHSVWKELLLCGQHSPAIAVACGELLGTLHAASWDSPTIAEELNDRTFFADLRVDPYYRHVAEQHAALRERMGQLIHSVWEHRVSLVHGDFSPKNLLVFDGGLMLIDFEVGHFGDPAFDVGFFLTHLLLKSIRDLDRFERIWTLAETFWSTYWTRLADRVPTAQIEQLAARGIQNLAGCTLARIDGKSPVDYLGDTGRETARRIGRRLLTEQPAGWVGVNRIVESERPT